jgi:hypothetical protein
MYHVNGTIGKVIKEDICLTYEILDIMPQQFFPQTYTRRPPAAFVGDALDKTIQRIERRHILSFFVAACDRT